jgi:hypothetical protein
MTWHQVWNWLIIPAVVALFIGGGLNWLARHARDR